ncbi:hypothetical protein MNEG_11662 [Monoraphidium neglectum]|uniref:TRAF3-interacting protein 1 C-terminal domain-containing protein n=1 Tax=Monoraphidium neglectum TaxID=145388 RepID=A0A0D2M4U5_9CHLO|nr:hypothetical protein MNEG_11662 [Monoraphidium neglectum]KIY96301.1 hypothetical protein MNEG_11662 [Monoraphidium neglectum]|eukprot:XP_013895321.1 hypothetical protein MNEG_11662 [Monoraphidium neglectum]
MAAVGVGEQEEGTGIILKRQVMLMLMLLLLLLLLRRRLRLLLLLQLLLLSFSERAPGTRSAAPHSLQRPRPSPRPAPGAAAATSPSCAIPCSGCARWAAFLATSSRLGDAAAAGGGGACSGSSTGSAGSAVRTGGPLGLQDRRPDFFTAPRMLVERERRAAAPLARNVEFLRDDADVMAKEHRFWATERRAYAERLAEEQRAAQDLGALEAQIADKDAQAGGARARASLKAAEERVIALKAAVLRGDLAVRQLLEAIVAH